MGVRICSWPGVGAFAPCPSNKFPYYVQLCKQLLNATVPLSFAKRRADILMIIHPWTNPNVIPRCQVNRSPIAKHYACWLLLLHMVIAQSVYMTQLTSPTNKDSTLNVDLQRLQSSTHQKGMNPLFISQHMREQPSTRAIHSDIKSNLSMWTLGLQSLLRMISTFLNQSIKLAQQTAYKWPMGMSYSPHCKGQ